MNLDQKTLKLALTFLLLALSILWLASRKGPAGVTSAEGDTFSSPVDSSHELAVGPSPGSVAPDFFLETLDGRTISLSDLRGQVVLLNFWATWCPPCRDEMPAIQKVYDQYQGHGFTVLGINFLETDAQVQGFVEELDLTFPILMDREGEVTARYGVRGLPTTFFVDRSGVIQNLTIGGPMTDTFIESKVVLLLNGPERKPGAVD